MRPAGGGGFRTTLERVDDIKTTTVSTGAAATGLCKLHNIFCRSLCDSSNSAHNHPQVCTQICNRVRPSQCSNPDTPPPSTPGESKPHISLILLGVSVSILVAAFIFFAFLAIRKFHAIWRSTRGRSEPGGDPDPEDVPDGFVDHPIWYIRTVGLQPSIINGIAVVRYRKENPLIDGTDCAVCLSEFQDDDPLRLLPKCNHAFHVPCIDTWLGSHTSCPICRAGVMNGAATVEIAVRNRGVVEEARVEIEGGDDEIAGGNGEDSTTQNVKLNEEGAVVAMDPEAFAGSSNSSSGESDRNPIAGSSDFGDNCRSGGAIW